MSSWHIGSNPYQCSTCHFRPYLEMLWWKLLNRAEQTAILFLCCSSTFQKTLSGTKILESMRRQKIFSFSCLMYTATPRTPQWKQIFWSWGKDWIGRLWRRIPDRCCPAVHGDCYLVAVLSCTVLVYKPLCIRNKPVQYCLNRCPYYRSTRYCSAILFSYHTYRHQC